MRAQNLCLFFFIFFEDLRLLGYYSLPREGKYVRRERDVGSSNSYTSVVIG